MLRASPEIEAERVDMAGTAETGLLKKKPEGGRMLLWQRQGSGGGSGLGLAEHG